MDCETASLISVGGLGIFKIDFHFKMSQRESKTTFVTLLSLIFILNKGLINHLFVHKSTYTNITFFLNILHHRIHVSTSHEVFFCVQYFVFAIQFFTKVFIDTIIRIPSKKKIFKNLIAKFDSPSVGI